MKQLGILDSAFINLEHPNTPQHIGGLGIYDQSTAPDGTVRFKEVIASFERKLKQLPLFRTRLVQVPGDMHRPYWVKDDNFDVEFHLHHIALPKPGDWRQLCILISRIHARPLNMSKPLWEAYIIEGLDNIPHLPKGCFAVYTKMHHSLVDGAGGASFMSALHDLEANPDVQPDEAEKAPRRFLADLPPSGTNLMMRSLMGQVANTLHMGKGIFDIGRDIGKTAYNVWKGTTPLPSIRAPKTRFNQPVGASRVMEAAVFDLEDIKLIKNVTGTKVNDVALAIIGGGLRQYLQHHGELPMESLAAVMPVNMRTRRGDNEEHNQLGSIFAELHTNIADPIERVHAIHHSTDLAKEFGEQNPLVDALKLAGFFSPRLSKRAVKMYVENNLTQHLPVNISTAISNVAGPPFPLYCSGAKLLRYHGVGLLTPGVGLFHLVFSYCGNITLTILGNRESLPDPAFYRECLEKSMRELKAAAQKLERAEAAKKTTAMAAAAAQQAAKPLHRGKRSASSATAATTPVRRTRKASSSRTKTALPKPEPVESLILNATEQKPGVYAVK